MTAAAVGHSIEADGYCNTCQAVPCQRPSGFVPGRGPGRPSGLLDQLARIELNQRTLLRHMNLPVAGENHSTNGERPAGATADRSEPTL